MLANKALQVSDSPTASLFLVLQGRSYEVGEEWVCRVRLRFKFGVELNANIPRVVGHLHNLDEIPFGVDAANPKARFL